MDYTSQLNSIIAALGSLQTEVSGLSSIFTGGFFWFALFCVGMILLFVTALLWLMIDFFKRLLWRH